MTIVKPVKLHKRLSMKTNKSNKDVVYRYLF